MPWSAWGPVGNGRSTGLSVPILPTPEKNRRDRLIRLAAQHADIGVPVAGVQKTTICAFTVEGEEKNEGHHPHIRWTKIPDLVHVYCGISSINRVFFPTLFGLPRTPHSDCHGLSNRLINTNTSRRSLFFAPKLREPHLQARQHILACDPADAMRLEHPLHMFLAQERCVSWGRDEIDQVPQPGFIGRRAQLEHLGIKSVQLVP